MSQIPITFSNEQKLQYVADRVFEKCRVSVLVEGIVNVFTPARPADGQVDMFLGYINAKVIDQGDVTNGMRTVFLEGQI